jgi:hypothetical protein
MKKCNKTRVRVVSVRKAVQFLLLIVLSLSGTLLRAQMIGIKLVNGRNGRPMAHSVNVWVGHKLKQAMPIPTDKNGIAWLRLTNNDEEANIHSDADVDLHSRRGVGVIDPVVKYDDSLRVNAGDVWCVPFKTSYSWLAIKEFSMKEVIEKGIVTPNACGKATATPTPGQVLIFVRPLNFWEKMWE